MLKIDNLSYRYPSRKQFTLKNINLTLADGEMLLLAGRSGCGKSTLIKAVSGLLGSEVSCREQFTCRARISANGHRKKQASWWALSISHRTTSFLR